jgi:ribosomal protein L11 methylase PrmA
MDFPLFIPYFQTTRYRVQTMIDLAEIKQGQLAADLGSGDGRIVIALAQTGAQAVGYEIDEALIKQSEENIKNERLEDSAKIYNKNFWQENLCPYAIITVYPMPDIMEKLEEKLRKELTPGSRVLLNYYPFPNWQEAIKKDNIYLYIR